MADQAPPDEKHLVFTEWAREQGVYIDTRIRPMQFNNRGIGINATDDIKKGERIIQVPPSAMLKSSLSAWANHRILPGNATIHGQLAAHLTLENEHPSRDYSPWTNTWPTIDDFNQVMPLRWPAEAQLLLPEPTKALLAQQNAKFEEDSKILEPALTPASKAKFTYNWLIVNTRSMYWQNNPTSIHRKRPQSKPTGTYVLSPFLDYFNHSDDACDVTQSKDGYVVTCQKDIKKGEEVYVTYGAHDNDTLLVEYGFVPSHNAHDSIKLDHLIIPKLYSSAKDALQSSHYLDDYALDATQASHRLRVALAALTLQPRQLDHFIATGDLHASHQPILASKLSQLVSELVKESEEGLNAVEEASKAGKLSQYQTTMLRLRWEQMRDLGKQWVERCGRGEGW